MGLRESSDVLQFGNARVSSGPSPAAGPDKIVLSPTSTRKDQIIRAPRARGQVQSFEQPHRRPEHEHEKRAMTIGRMISAATYTRLGRQAEETPKRRLLYPSVRAPRSSLWLRCASTPSLAGQRGRINGCYRAILEATPMSGAKALFKAVPPGSQTRFLLRWEYPSGGDRPGPHVFTSCSNASRRSSCARRRNADALETSVRAPSWIARVPPRGRLYRDAPPRRDEPWRHFRGGRQLCYASLSASLSLLQART